MSEAFEPAAHAAVGKVRPDLEDDAADEAGVDRCASPRPCGRRPSRSSPTIDVASVVGELVRGRQLDGEPVLGLGHERVELDADLLELSRSALLRDEPDEVAHELVGVDGDLGEHLGLARRVDLGVAQERAQLGHLVHRGRDRGEVACHRADTVRFLRGLEERAGVHAVRDRH